MPPMSIKTHVAVATLYFLSLSHLVLYSLSFLPIQPSQHVAHFCSKASSEVVLLSTQQCQTLLPCNSHQLPHNTPAFGTPTHHLSSHKCTTLPPLKMCPPAIIQARGGNYTLLKYELYQKESLLQVFSASYLGRASGFWSVPHNRYVVTQDSRSTHWSNWETHSFACLQGVRQSMVHQISAGAFSEGKLNWTII